MRSRNLALSTEYVARGRGETPQLRGHSSA
jgi:hypothetical protein